MSSILILVGSSGFMAYIFYQIDGDWQFGAAVGFMLGIIGLLSKGSVDRERTVPLRRPRAYSFGSVFIIVIFILLIFAPMLYVE